MTGFPSGGAGAPRSPAGHPAEELATGGYSVSARVRLLVVGSVLALGLPICRYWSRKSWLFRAGGPENAMAFLIRGAGTRVARSCDSSPSGAPSLHIAFEMDEP